jgi:hypothetical protein
VATTDAYARDGSALSPAISARALGSHVSAQVGRGRLFCWRRLSPIWLFRGGAPGRSTWTTSSSGSTSSTEQSSSSSPTGSSSSCISGLRTRTRCRRNRAPLPEDFSASSLPPFQQSRRTTAIHDAACRTDAVASLAGSIPSTTSTRPTSLQRSTYRYDDDVTRAPVPPTDDLFFTNQPSTLRNNYTTNCDAVMRGRAAGLEYRLVLAYVQFRQSAAWDTLLNLSMLHFLHFFWTLRCRHAPGYSGC